MNNFLLPPTKLNEPRKFHWNPPRGSGNNPVGIAGSTSNSKYFHSPILIFFGFPLFDLFDLKILVFLGLPIKFLLDLEVLFLLANK
jgi:hypothetical protein